MNRVDRITIRTHGLGIVVALMLVACGVGDNTRGQENSLAVSTPISPISALTFELKQFTTAVATGPVASMSATPISGQISLQVNFSAANVSRNSAAIVRYDWDFGDGNMASGASVSHRYDIPDAYTATLILTDANGQTDTTSRQINVFGGMVDNSQLLCPTACISFMTSTIASSAAVMPLSHSRITAGMEPGLKT